MSNNLDIPGDAVTRPKERSSRHCLVKAIQRHYSISVKIKTDAEIESEKWLFCNYILFNRWFCLPAAFVIQFCCGSIYAWSVFNKPIDTLIYDANSHVAPITFYIAVGFYGCAAALMGPWLERNGPRRACLVGAVLAFIGNLVTALAIHLKCMGLVFVGYGFFLGSGFGICYISPVSALQKWFPDMRGLGAGFATCGFGVGSVVVGKIAIPLMETFGLPLTFVILGVFFVILMTVSALVLRTPPPSFNPPLGRYAVKEPKSDIEMIENCSSQPPSPPPEMSLVEALTSTDFRFMMIMFIGDIAFGLVLASRLANMITDIFGKSAEQAATVVSINGAINFIGRLSFSIISDYIGRKNCFILLLTSQVVVLGCFSTMTEEKAFLAFWISTGVITATYGAAFGVIPAFLTDKFGSANIGACHGICIFGWAASGVIGGFVFTIVFNSMLSAGNLPTDPIVYNVNAYWLLGIASIGWISVHFVQPTSQDKRVIKFFRNLCSKSA